MSRTCRCKGENPNCYICGGRGIIDDTSIGEQTKTDWSLLAGAKKAKYSSRDDSTYGDEVHISVVGRKRKGLGSLGKKKRPQTTKSAKSSNPSRKKKWKAGATVEINGKPLGKETNVATQPKQKTQTIEKPPKKKARFNNPFADIRDKLELVVESGRRERSLDGAKGYHNFREGGRFGSFPSFDGDD